MLYVECCLEFGCHGLGSLISQYSRPQVNGLQVRTSYRHYYRDTLEGLGLQWTVEYRTIES
jgi:hypothetical protein